MRNLRLLFGILAIGAMVGTAVAQTFVGTHTGEQRSVEPKENYAIVRMLRLDRNGRAELSTSYRGTKPKLTRKSMNAFGSLLDDVAREKIIRHVGTWRAEDNQVWVTLSTLNLAAGPDQQDAELAFDVRDGFLVSSTEGSDLYGDSRMRLRMGSTTATGGGNGGGVQTQAGNTFTSTVRNPNQTNEFTVTRTLRLEQNGRAVMEWSYKGDTPDLTRSNIRYFGDVLSDVARLRILQHSGTWRAANNNVQVNLTTLGAREELASSLTFAVQGKNLVLTSWDKESYGSQKLTFVGSAMVASNPNEGSGDTIGDVVGRHLQTFTLDSGAQINRELIFEKDGTVRLTTEYPASRRTAISDIDQSNYGMSIIRLGSQRSYTYEGTWQVRGNEILITFNRVDDDAIRTEIRLQRRNGVLVGMAYETRQFGTALLKFSPR